MTTPTVPRRRLALLRDEERFDLSIPFGTDLGAALLAGGIVIGDGRHVLLDRDGSEVNAETRADDLVDGGLYTVVDLRAAGADPRGVAADSVARVDHGTVWFLLGIIGPITLAGVAAGSPGSGIRWSASAILGVAALVTALAWAARSRAGLVGAVALLAPATLAFAAGALAMPAGLADGVRLAAVAGLLAAAVLTAVLTASASSPELRAAAGTITLILAVLAGIWGLALLLHWEGPAAPAISLGAVPLALRALPSTLVNLPEGYFIDYRHFISNRWTVRGAIPDSPGAVRMDTIRGVVDGSSARLVAGVSLLSLVAGIAAPLALLRPWGDDPFVVSGGITLIVCALISLLLTPRHTTGFLLRWLPRAAAAVVLGVATWLTLTRLEVATLSLIALVLFIVAVISALVVVPISRGVSSLVWSRLGDTIEWIAVALALPAALLYSGVLDLLRGMMAG